MKPMFKESGRSAWSRSTWLNRIWPHVISWIVFAGIESPGPDLSVFNKNRFIPQSSRLFRDMGRQENCHALGRQLLEQFFKARLTGVVDIGGRLIQQ